MFDEQFLNRLLILLSTKGLPERNALGASLTYLRSNDDVTGSLRIYHALLRCYEKETVKQFLKELENKFGHELSLADPDETQDSI